MPYTLRFPFRIPKEQAINLQDREFDLGKMLLRLSPGHAPTWYVGTVTGFANEADARAYTGLFHSAMRWVLINSDIASETELRFSELIGGTVDAVLPAVYSAEKQVRVVAGGDATVIVGIAEEQIVGQIREFLEFRHPENTMDNKLCVALELYSSHFREISQNARFLALVMVLEALATGVRRSDQVTVLLTGWQEQTETLKRSLPADDPLAAELDSLSRETFHRRESSIRNQIRSLVLDAYTRAGRTEADAAVAARTALRIYDSRSKLVHDGTVDCTALAESLADAKRIVVEVLRSRFRDTFTTQREGQP
jgi:hypothetical protein